MSASTPSISRATYCSTFDRDMDRRIEQLERLLDKEFRKSNQLFMDRLLNYKLDRDNLPEDTPLPIYLAHREPRSLSPPSRWDAIKESRKLVSLPKAAAASAAASAAAATTATPATPATAAT